MKSKILIASLQLFFVVGYTSAQENFAYFHDKIRGYSISFPSNWEIKENYLNTAVCAFRSFENSEDSFREGVSVVQCKKESTSSLDDFFQTNIHKAILLKEDYHEYESGLTRIDSLMTKYLICTYSFSEMKYQAIYFCFEINSTTCFLLAGMSTPSRFKQYREIFEKIAHTFTLDKTN